MFATLLTRPRRTTAAALAGAVALLAAHPTLAQSVGVDVWNVPGLNEQIRAAAGESERLAAEDEVVRRRIAAKEAIVAELLAARITLDEATARFVELNAARPNALAMVRTCYPGASDREKTARNVISYALGRTPADARGDVARRLDAELRRMLSA